MNVEDKISVIIPINNDEYFLSKCLDSLVAQTYQNLEIILLDNDSTDNSGIICDDYKQKDYRIVVVHKENKDIEINCSFGTSISGGKYISFLTPNSVLEPSFYEKLIDSAKTFDSDIVKCDYSIEKSNTKQAILEHKEYLEIPTTSFFEVKDYPSLLLLQPAVSSALYKRSFLKNIESLEKLNHSIENQTFYYETLLAAKKISFISSIKLDYSNNSNSFDSNIYTKKAFKQLKQFADTKNFMRANKYFYQYKEEFYFSLIRSVQTLLCNFVKDTDKSKFLKKAYLLIKDIETEGRFTYKYFSSKLKLFTERLLAKDFHSLLFIYTKERSKLLQFSENIKNLFKEKENGLKPRPSFKLFIPNNQPSIFISNDNTDQILIDMVPEEYKTEERKLEYIDWTKNFCWKDSIDDNIASNRDFYGDLTAYYWIWKNYNYCANTDYIGFMTESEHFLFIETDEKLIEYSYFDKKYSNILTHFQFNLYEWLEKYDLIIPEPTRYEGSLKERLSVENKELLSDLTDILKEKYTAFYNHFEKYELSTLAYTSKMFIMNKIDYNEMSGFIFSILSDLKTKIEKEENLSTKYKEKDFNEVWDLLIGGYISYFISANIKVKTCPISKISDTGICKDSKKYTDEEKEQFVNLYQ